MKSHGKSKAVLTAVIFEVNLLQSSRFGESQGTAKHRFHVPHVRNVPPFKRLVERFGPPEHLFHIRDGGNVPCADRLVEALRYVEHTVHVGNA